MAAIVGNTGTVSIQPSGGGTEQLLNLFQWGGNWVREDFDSSIFTASAVAITPGLHKMTGTCEGFTDDTTALNLATALADGLDFVLTSSTGRTYTFDGILTDISPLSEVGQLARFTASFESDGAIATA